MSRDEGRPGQGFADYRVGTHGQIIGTHGQIPRSAFQDRLHHTDGRAVLDALHTVCAQHFGHDGEWMVLDDTTSVTIIVLAFAAPRFGMMELERDLRSARAAGVALDLRLVDPRLDREALDSLFRLGGLDALRRELGF